MCDVLKLFSNDKGWKSVHGIDENKHTKNKRLKQNKSNITFQPVNIFVKYKRFVYPLRPLFQPAVKRDNRKRY